jgi:hypothetical protein
MELYEDRATKGDHVGELNGVHPIWIRFDSGHARPAELSEIQLWNAALEQAAKDIEAQLEGVSLTLRQAVIKMIRERKVQE